MEDNKLENQAMDDSEVDPSAPVTQSPPTAKPAQKSKKETSKAGKFFRSLFIWLGVIAVSFLAGVGTYHFTRYTPLEKSFSEAQSALTDANSELSTFRSDKQKTDITISTLQEELSMANSHVDILQLLTDTSEARLALIAKDVDGAKTALENSANTLDRILPIITEVDAALAQSMSQRLGLILSELERDSKSAQVDLELLTKDLLTAEEALSK